MKRCPNCNTTIYSRKLGYCPECRQSYPSHGYLSEGDANFSLIPTKFDNMELLIAALREFELDVRRNSHVRGDGGKTTADVVVVLESGCDLGYFLSNGKIMLVADLVGLNRNLKSTQLLQLIQRIHGKYLDLLANQEER